MIETENMTLNMIQIKAKEELISKFGKNFWGRMGGNEYSPPRLLSRGIPPCASKKNYFSLSLATIPVVRIAQGAG